MDHAFLLGGPEPETRLLGRMANRHGLIAGATGTGKTVTLRVLAEGFSRMGVPVFMADVKGDLAGIFFAGDQATVQKQIDKGGIADWSAESFPVVFWDVYGKEGHPLRATISEMGPLLLSRLLNLNVTQSAILTMVFKIADDQRLPLLDLKDLQAMIQNIGEHARELSGRYGNIAPASLATIQRGLITLGEQGGETFFGEPMLQITDLMRTAEEGKGVVNILAATRLMHSPEIYSTMLLWLLSELFEDLPERGDLEKPRLVFFFDEAHLLFDTAPRVLLQKIEQVVRLIRSKGIGVYFITQNPNDVPDIVLGQLGNRIQHALRAFTEKDRKSVRAAAQNFRTDGTVDVEEAITQLGTGEALISLLDNAGSPLPVRKIIVRPPGSRLGTVTEAERGGIISASPMAAFYGEEIDRDSAYERLQARMSGEEPGSAGKAEKGSSIPASVATALSAFLLSAVRTIGTQVGRQIIRGVLGGVSRAGSRR